MVFHCSKWIEKIILKIIFFLFMTNIKWINTISDKEIVLVWKTKNWQSITIDCPLWFLNNRTEALNLLKKHWLSIDDFWPEWYALVEKGYELSLSLEFTRIHIIKGQVFEDFDNIMNLSRH